MRSVALGYQVLWRGRVEGEFTGFDGEALFKLSNGTYWLQAEYKYWYYYSYCPEVELYRSQGGTLLRVVGQSELVAVVQLGNVIESQIAGTFEGWDGDSEYELTNGQVWRQDRYRYEYRYKYSPHVTIYDTPGGITMDVDGCRASVKRIR
jgi:hypothetical protein